VADPVLLMPVEGVRVSQVTDTWQAPRGGGRLHDGQDVFAPRGTPVRSATAGFVYRIDDLSLGGLSVTIIGDGYKRYFYTHFDRVPDDLREGQRVTTDTVIGFVGTSGNAVGTPPHLHFGVYGGRPVGVRVDPARPAAAPGRPGLRPSRRRGDARGRPRCGAGADSGRARSRARSGTY
jgi:murein DD-endopeptidase MepM/ murein hydrolase activator NlpD